ncbi:hypothetical protein BDZ89DRAFT_1141906 [Hymenopellis radicata]|nr:hypothetical protein BDZ89DRAFT_1141906 [Hymenopellis radicata]
MSDPPPKPKIGSLRDRIAAFEKPNAASTPGPAPVPRPKPGNLQWKPRPPSPTQPAAAAATAALTAEEKKASGMSASDAKESIGKAGSLKERMAALQGRGGFGAPAPPAADIGQAGYDVAEDAPAPEKSLEIPLEESPSAEAEAAPVEGDAAEADPEEEERQRRAALTARMARLGGARVGMGPPVFGRKPTPKPTPDDESTKSPEPAKSPEIAKSPDSQAESKSEYFPSSAAAASSDSLPVSSANKSNRFSWY